MSRALGCRLVFSLIITSTFLAAKDEPGIVMFWPSQDNATIKLTFGTFRKLESLGGKMTLLSEVTVENLSSTPLPEASFSVFLLDKDRVRIGSGFLHASNIQPGQKAKVQFQCDSVGTPVSIALATKTFGGAPTAANAIPLQVLSTPPGASLRVDGVDGGFTPATVNLTVGNHNLELQKDGFALTTVPVDIAPNDLPNGSIKVTLGGLANDVVGLRDGTSLNGDVLSMSLETVVIRIDGKERKIDRNQVSKVFLVERTITHTSTIESAPSK